VRILRGKVVSGVGNFGYWIEKLREHYYRKTDLWLFAGTLNVELGEPYDLPKARTRLEAEEYGGTVSVNIVACEILGHKAFILRTDKADTEVEGRRIIEVACEVKLRDKYGLRDGDAVEVTVGE
jgi:riboflavin kinase